MPRPKRPKMVHTVPTLRGAGLGTASTSRKQAPDLSSPISSRVNNSTDDSDGLVVSKRSNGQRKDPSKARAYTMTGALDGEESQTRRSKPPPKQIVEEVHRIVREADHAAPAVEKRKTRARYTGTTEGRGDVSSTVSAQPAIAGSRRPSLLQRSDRTPLGHSLTSAALTFKKRPRQPSLLQIVQAQNAQSELDLDSDDEGSNLYDFRPDDESTPLVKSTSQTRASNASSSSTRNPSSRKRKLATPVLQVQASQTENIPSSPSNIVPRDLAQHPRLNSEDEQIETLSPALPARHASVTPPPEIFSDTFAPPQSSSPEPPPIVDRAPQKPSKTTSKSSKKSKNDRGIDRSPAPADSRVQDDAPVLKPLTTASLQNLLPRRRARKRVAKGAYEVPSSSENELDVIELAEDEDELSFHATNKRRRGKTLAGNMQAKKSGKASTKAATEANPGGKGKRISKTYTRKSIVHSDESDSGGDDGYGESRLPAKPTAKSEDKFDSKTKQEMERLAAKFQEVDEYALDFEDMTGSSSQMIDAR